MQSRQVMNVNIPETPDQRLRDRLRAAEERRWLEQNQQAIAHYNRRVAEHGLLSDGAELP
jgi:post-segregation antitoxin (ccd killing protein)